MAVTSSSSYDKYQMAERLKPGGIFLINTPYSADEVWARLPKEVQAVLNQKQARLYVINAAKIARECGLAAHQYGYADGVLPPDQYSAGRQRADGASGCNRQKLQQQRVRNWLSATGRRWRWPANRCSRCRCSRSMPAVRTGRQWCLTPPRISSKPSRRRCWPDWATPFRLSRFRLTEPGRWARPAGKNATLPKRFPSGRRAVHPVQPLRGGLPALGHSRQSGVAQKR